MIDKRFRRNLTQNASQKPRKTKMITAQIELDRNIENASRTTAGQQRWEGEGGAGNWNYNEARTGSMQQRVGQKTIG